MIQATKFKETELGLIPEEWDVKDIDSVLEKIIDYRGKTPKKSEKGIITLSAKSIKKGRIDYSQTYFISKETFEKWEVRGKPEIGDVLLTTEGPLGEVAQYDRENVAIAQRLITLRGKPTVLDNYFLKYYLISRVGQFQLNARASGSTVQGIKQSEFRKIKILIPNISEQKAIAKILSDLDSKIELLQQQNKTLEKIGQVLFKQWFVDFEFPNEEGKPYKSSGGKMIDSELGEIPEGWSVDLLGNYVESVSGCSYTSKGLQDSDEALVTLKSIGVDGFKQEGFKEYTGDYKDKHVVEDGDIVVAHTDLTQNRIVLGKPAIVRDLGKYKKMIASMDLSIVRPIKLLNRPFIFYLLSTNGFHGHAQGYSNGTTVVHLSRKAIPEFSFVVPAQNVLDQFKSILINVFDRFRINEQNMLSLSKTRDLLLPKLMTGKIRVPLEIRN